jgi:hypothetical protein
MTPLSPDPAAARARRSPIIELELRSVDRLFNPIDPSPLEARDIQPDVEEFIVSWAEEYSLEAELTLRVHLEEWPATDPSNLVRTAIHNYFRYRADVNDLEFRRLMRRGRISLIIGSLFLVACLVTIRLLFGEAESTWAGIGRESLTIAGWVAMWRPMEIYLYDWWPLRRKGRWYEKLSRIPVEVVREGNREPAAPQ